MHSILLEEHYMEIYYQLKIEYLTTNEDNLSVKDLPLVLIWGFQISRVIHFLDQTQQQQLHLLQTWVILKWDPQHNPCSVYRAQIKNQHLILTSIQLQHFSTGKIIRSHSTLPTKMIRMIYKVFKDYLILDLTHNPILSKMWEEEIF